MKKMLEQMTPEAQEAFEDACFAAWLKKVNEIVSAKWGLGVDDGCDWPSRDCYEDGAMPLEGAREWRRAQS